MEILQTNTNVSLNNKDMCIITDGVLDGLVKFGIDCIVRDSGAKLSDLILEHKKNDIILLKDLRCVLENDKAITESDIIKHITEKANDFVRQMRAREDYTFVDTTISCWTSERIIKGAKLENFTPHDVRVFEAEKDGGRQSMFLPKSNNPARVHFDSRIDGYINDSPTNNINSLEIKGLPPKKENALYIVSFFVLYMLRGQRDDIIAPDSAQLVKDKATRMVIGTRGFIRFK